MKLKAKKRLSIFQMNHNTIIHDTKLFRQEFGTVEKERNIMEKIWRKKFLWRLFSLGHPDIFSSILVSCWSLPEKMLHCQKSRDFHALILLDPGTITIYRGSLLFYFCIGFFVKQHLAQEQMVQIRHVYLRLGRWNIFPKTCLDYLQVINSASILMPL